MAAVAVGVHEARDKVRFLTLSVFFVLTRR